jgi:hypothetical protein
MCLLPFLRAKGRSDGGRFAFPIASPVLDCFVSFVPSCETGSEKCKSATARGPLRTETSPRLRTLSAARPPRREISILLTDTERGEEAVEDELVVDAARYLA